MTIEQEQDNIKFLIDSFMNCKSYSETLKIIEVRNARARARAELKAEIEETIKFFKETDKELERLK